MDSYIFLGCLLILKLILDFSPLSGSHYVSDMAYGLICVVGGGVMLFQYPHGFVGYFSEVIGIGFLGFGIYKWLKGKSNNTGSD